MFILFPSYENGKMDPRDGPASKSCLLTHQNTNQSFTPPQSIDLYGLLYSNLSLNENFHCFYIYALQSLLTILPQAVAENFGDSRTKRGCNKRVRSMAYELLTFYIPSLLSHANSRQPATTRRLSPLLGLLLSVWSKSSRASKMAKVQLLLPLQQSWPHRAPVTARPQNANAGMPL